jgi:hypothetical protein
MKNALFAVLYTLGLSTYFPFLVVHHRSNAALAMFIAPIVAALVAEILSRTFRLTKESAENRVIWLVGAFIILAQAARLTLDFDRTDGFTEYLALNALYQIVVVLIFAASERRENKAPVIPPAQPSSGPC